MDRPAPDRVVALGPDRGPAGRHGAGGLALRTAVLESNRVRGGRSWTRFIRTAKAPELPVILLEDLGALCGLVFALIGVVMTLIIGEGRWDAAGTAMIGLLLIVIAVVLAVSNECAPRSRSHASSTSNRMSSAPRADHNARAHPRNERTGVA